MRSNLGGNRAFLPSRANPPRPLPKAPVRIPLRNPPQRSFPRPFPLHQQLSETLRTCSKSLAQVGTVLAAPQPTANACHRNWSAAPSSLATGSRLATISIKSFALTVPFHPVYVNIATSTNFGCSKNFRKRRLGFVPTSYIPVPYHLTLGVLRNQSRVRLSRPAFKCPFI